jgi:hypothetical protein
MSGYIEPVLRSGAGDAAVELIDKPVTERSLLAKIDAVLSDSEAAADGAGD